MSHRSRAGTGSSRGQTGHDTRREYENDNAQDGAANVGFFRSSNAVDVFRDHDLGSLQVPREQLARLSFHDMSEASPGDVPMPLTIRKSSTPSTTPHGPQFGSSPISSRDTQNHTQSEHNSLPAASALDESRDELPTQQCTSPPNGPDAVETGSVKSYQTMAQDEYHSQFVQTARQRPRGVIMDLGSTPHASSPGNGDVRAGKQPAKELEPGEDSGEDTDLEAEPANGDRVNYVKFLVGIFGPGNSDCHDLLRRPPRESLPFEPAASSDQPRVDAWVPHTPSSVFDVDTRNETHDPTRLRNGSSYISSSDEESPSDIAATSRLVRERKVERIVSHQGMHHGPGVKSCKGPFVDDVRIGAVAGPSNQRARGVSNPSRDLGEASNGYNTPIAFPTLPRSEALRRNQQPLLRPKSRRPKPVATFHRVNSFPEVREQQNKGEFSRSGVTSQNIETDTPEPLTAKMAKDKGKDKQPEKKAKETPLPNPFDPWDMMVLGQSTPHEAIERSAKRLEAQGGSQPAKITPSSDHSRGSKHSDNPAPTSSKPTSSTRRVVSRVASKFFPKLRQSSETRADLNETHKSPDPNPSSNRSSNRSSNTKTREQQELQKQHRVTVTSSTSSSSRPFSRFRSTTITSPTPARPSNGPDIGFPSSLTPNNSYQSPPLPRFSAAPWNRPQHTVMQPPTRPPPPPPQFRRASDTDQAMSTESTAEAAPRVTAAHPENGTVHRVPSGVHTGSVAYDTAEPATDDTISPTPQATTTQVEATGIASHVPTELTPEAVATNTANIEAPSFVQLTIGIAAVEIAPQAPGIRTTQANSQPTSSIATSEGVDQVSTTEVSSADLDEDTGADATDAPEGGRGGAAGIYANSVGSAFFGSNSETLNEDGGSLELERTNSWETVVDSDRESTDNNEGGENGPNPMDGGEDNLGDLPLAQEVQVLYLAVEALPQVDRLELLREELGSEYVWWTDSQKHPKRPNDGRVWHSTNLRCDKCSPSCCVCGAPCCKWTAASNVLADDSATESDKRRAGWLLQTLQEVMPEGLDPNTHVRCSEFVQELQAGSMGPLRLALSKLLQRV
ncbi:hypothetical protein FQN54_002321 [Arachnomyces sp. PD_36]|nr:hypothetical protein FQN54_002321 [Arachnomyces sp. PD_36]